MSSKSKEITKMFTHLTRELDPDLCAECGACVASCPFNSLKLGENGPALEGTCTACGLCYTQCPQFTRVQTDAEKIFGKKSDFEGVGIYKNAYSARSSSPEIKENAQDGGTVTSILYDLLDEGFIDAAVVTGTGDEPWKPEAKVVTSPEEVLEYGGTIYTTSPALKGLKDAVELYRKNEIGFVGMPCQVKGLRQMEIGAKPLRKLSSQVKVIIGLFCMESFPYENIVKIVEDKLGLEISNISKFDIKKGDFLAYTEDGDVEEIPVGELKEFMCGSCSVCLDFASELADISVGSVGAPDGYNAVLTRTEIGEEAFQIARSKDALESEPLQDVKLGLGLIEKLSNSKKKKRAKEIKRRISEEEPIPPRILNCPKCGEEFTKVDSSTYKCENCETNYTLDEILEYQYS